MSAHLIESGLILYQNDALDVSILRKVVARPPEVIGGHKSRIKVKFQSYPFKKKVSVEVSRGQI